MFVLYSQQVDVTEQRMKETLKLSTTLQLAQRTTQRNCNKLDLWSDSIVKLSKQWLEGKSSSLNDRKLSNMIGDNLKEIERLRLSMLTGDVQSNKMEEQKVLLIKSVLTLAFLSLT